MKYLFRVAVLVVSLLGGGMALAQEAWVQIEARPTEAEATDRARAYSAAFADVQGYKLSSGWYGIVLGPYDSLDAQAKLEVLLGEGLIPRDSFVVQADKFTSQFWPAAGAEAPATTEPSQEGALTVTPAPADEETLPQAMAAEAALTPSERMDIQRAMQFFGAYAGTIDGSFGKGTRASMATWQGQNGYQATGVLTSAQRKALIEGWQAEQKALGLATLTEPEAGITIDMPMGLVAFDHYEPPFVAYQATGNSGYQAFLISRRGDQSALGALYARVQAMTGVPNKGDRSLDASGFVVNGQGTDSSAFVEARLEGGMIKGFGLIWPNADAERAAKVLKAMQTSFAPVEGAVLDETLGEPSSTSAADLTSGLDVRRPILSRTGVFIDGAGHVLTAADTVKSCGKITLNLEDEVTVDIADAETGLAVLTPAQALAPAAFAQLSPTLPAKDASVTVAGYSYGDRLTEPVITAGTFAEGQGLDGNRDVERLTMATLDGDAGGAVLDGAGRMVGLLIPPQTPSGKTLPADVSLALQSATVARVLEANSMPLPTAPADAKALAPEDLATQARKMTVLVSCWE